MIGETVTVVGRRETGRDSFNEPIFVEDEVVVDNVLVAPKFSQDLAGALRVEGDLSALELHFPKSFTGSLRGKLVRVRGVTYRVEGDPSGYTVVNTPLAWWIPVKAVRVNG